MHVQKATKELIKECDGYIIGLKAKCVDRMFAREYSWRAKYPFKVISYVNAMTWRMYDMSSSALTLMKHNAIIPSLCLVRVCWENLVATYEMKNLVQNCCEQQNVTNTIDETLMRLLYSNRFDEDNRYVGVEQYKQFKKYKAKNILTLVQILEKDYPATKDFYSTICEFVHPNGDGVSGSYSYLDESTHTVTFGPQFDQDSELFPIVITTLNCAISLYLDFVESIQKNIVKFTTYCESALSGINNDSVKDTDNGHSAVFIQKESLQS